MPDVVTPGVHYLVAHARRSAEWQRYRDDDMCHCEKTQEPRVDVDAAGDVEEASIAVDPYHDASSIKTFAVLQDGMKRLEAYAQTVIRNERQPRIEDSTGKLHKSRTKPAEGN